MKEQKIHQDTQKSLEALRIQRRSPPSKNEITSAVNEAKGMPVVKKVSHQLFIEIFTFLRNQKEIVVGPPVTL